MGPLFLELELQRFLKYVYRNFFDILFLIYLVIIYFNFCDIILKKLLEENYVV